MGSRCVHPDELLHCQRAVDQNDCSYLQICMDKRLGTYHLELGFDHTPGNTVELGVDRIPGNTVELGVIDNVGMYKFEIGVDYTPGNSVELVVD